MCVCVCVCVCALSHSVVSNSFVTPWTVACHAPLSMGFSRQEYGSGLPFPSPGDLPNPGIEPGSPVLARGFFTIWATREAHMCTCVCVCEYIHIYIYTHIHETKGDSPQGLWILKGITAKDSKQNTKLVPFLGVLEPWKAAWSHRGACLHLWLGHPMTLRRVFSPGVYLEKTVSNANASSRSVQFSCSVMPNSLWPHGLQHARPPCPSPTPGVYSNSSPLSQWCQSTISSSVVCWEQELHPWQRSWGRRLGIRKGVFMGGCPPLPLSEKRINLQLQLIKFLGVMVFQPTNSFGSPLACLNRFFRPHVIAQSLPTVRGMRCSKLFKYRFFWAVKRLIRNCIGEGFFTCWANVCC